MHSFSKTGFLLLMLLALPALACSMSLDLPDEVPIADIEVSEEDVAAASTRAAIAMATAANVASTAVSSGSELAGTAVAEGADMVATASAVATAAAQATGQAIEAPNPLPNPVGENGDLPFGTLATVDGTFTLTVSEADFNQFLANEPTVVNSDSLQNLQVDFHEGFLTLTGDITQPIATSFEANFVPAIVDGNLQFNVTDATVGGFPAPQPILDTIESQVQSVVNQTRSQLPADITMQTVGVTDTTLTITGTRG